MTSFTIVLLIVGGAELLGKGAATIASRLGIAPVIVGLTVVAFGTSAPELAVSVSAVLRGNADVAFGNVVGSNIADILLILGASAVVGGLAVQQRIVRFGVPLLVVGSVVPELATSITAALRGQRDIAVGNVIGSNLFNLMSVLGLSSIVSSNGIPVSDVSLRLDFPVMLAATIVLVPIVWNGFEIKRWEGFVLIAFYAVYVVYLALDANDSDATGVIGDTALIVTPLVVMTFAVTGFQGWRRHRLGLRDSV